MKKIILLSLCVVLLFTSCGQNQLLCEGDNCTPTVSNATSSPQNDDAPTSKGDAEFVAKKADDSYEIFTKQDDGSLLPVELTCGVSIYGDWIYFVENGSKLYRINKSGENTSLVLDLSQKINVEEMSINYLNVLAEDRILIRYDGFFLYLFDGSSMTEIDWYAVDIHTYGDDIYTLNKDHSIYRYNISNKSSEICLYANKEAENQDDWKNLNRSFVIVDGFICHYQILPDGLYCYNGKNDVLIDDNEGVKIYSLFSYNGKLYYASEKDGKIVLCSYDPHSNKLSDVTILADYDSGLYIKDGIVSYLTQQNTAIEVELS